MPLARKVGRCAATQELGLAAPRTAAGRRTTGRMDRRFCCGGTYGGVSRVCGARKISVLCGAGVPLGGRKLQCARHGIVKGRPLPARHKKWANKTGIPLKRHPQQHFVCMKSARCFDTVWGHYVKNGPKTVARVLRGRPRPPLD